MAHATPQPTSVNVIIVSDSRGGALGNYLHSADIPSDLHINDHVLRGASYTRLFDELRTQVEHHRHRGQQIIDIFNSGICSITERETHAWGLEIAFHDPSLPDICHKIDEIVKFCTYSDCNLGITISIPADLSQAKQHYIRTRKLRESRYLPAQTEAQQARQNFVDEINACIKSRTNNNNVKLINLFYDIMARSKKGRCRHESVLGRTSTVSWPCPPGPKLKTQIFNKIGGTCRAFWSLITCNLSEPTTSPDNETDQEQDQETWRFKRTRHYKAIQTHHPKNAMLPYSSSGIRSTEERQ